jgi:predicted metal-dependent hydrolase
MEQDKHWPPAYTLRRSAKAKRVLLKISPRLGLEVVVPIKFRQAISVPTLLAEQRAWIEQQLARIARINKSALELPTSIELLVMAKVYAIEYSLADDEQFRLEELNDHKLKLYGNDKQALAKLLRQWLLAQGKVILPDLLQACSLECNLPYSDVKIRLQKTRWGSCNAAKTISLNCSLLLLPPDLMRYVLIHELCHTQELNHSAKFWQWVAKFDPLWQQHRRQLRAYHQHLPAWTTV